MSKEDFLHWESDDPFVYEWNNGILEPTIGMKQNEMLISVLIENAFYQTQTFRNGGRLRAEVDCWVTDKQMRRPDLAFYTDEQIRKASQGERVIPAFVIEIISEFDDIIKVEKKLIEYFQAGVKVVWRVVGEIKTVYVYTSPKTITVCTHNDTINAAPAVSDFQLTASELFAE